MRGQDIVVALRLARPEGPVAYAELAKELMMSPSEVHAAIRRLREAGLAGDKRTLLIAPLLEFLEHGLRFVFPARPGARSVGVPTAHSAPPLVRLVASEEPLVWPHPSGPAQGAAVQPLYRTVPRIALADPLLHELLALVDALRLGRARERKLALGELRRRMQSDGS